MISRGSFEVVDITKCISELNKYSNAHHMINSKIQCMLQYDMARDLITTGTHI